MTVRRPGTTGTPPDVDVAELLRDVTGLERLHGLQLSLLEGLRRKLEVAQQSVLPRRSRRRRPPRRGSKR